MVCLFTELGKIETSFSKQISEGTYLSIAFIFG